MQDIIREFHKKFNHPIGIGFDDENLLFRNKLIVEESLELSDALQNKDRKKILDGIADLLYVVIGTAICIGVDSDELVKRVHESNMNKKYEGIDVKPSKPKGWTEPNFDDILESIDYRT